MQRDLGFVVGVGVASGALEAAVRAHASHGWVPAEALGFSLLALVAGLIVATGGWCVGTIPRFLRMRRRVVGAIVVALHAAMWWRADHVLNEHLSDPRVWLCVPGIGLVGGALGWAVTPALTAGRLWSLAGAALVTVAVRSSAPKHVRGGHPNVLVVSMDTTRADHVGDKPVFERLSHEGTRFSQAIAAAPITEPSHLAMFTGVAPFRSGVVSNGTDIGGARAVWRNFAAAGYATAGFVSGFPLHGRYGWGAGIDVWDDDFGAWPGMQSLSLVKAWNQVALRDHALRERRASRVVARAARWLSAHREESTFAFVHFYDAHGPYEPEGANLGVPPTDGPPLALPGYWPARDRAITSTEWLSRAYDAEVRDVDAAVGDLLRSLGPALDSTIVVVTADHGESLTEHGTLFDHGDDLYDPSLRVPWVVRWPGHVVAGGVVPCQVGGVDLAPTLLELAGLPPEPSAVDGRSRASELTGGPCQDRPVVSSTTAGRFVAKPPVDHALRRPGEKLVVHDAASRGGAAERFDLSADPGELSSRAAPAEQLSAFRLLLSQGVGGVPAADDADTRAGLEALGYLDGAPP